LKKDKEFNKKVRSLSRSGEKGSNWKGGKKISKKGYVLVLARGHPMAERGGYIMEHRLVMAEYLGRLLEKDEVVHHINKKKYDNCIENLKLMKRGEHTTEHHTGMKRSKETCIKISESKKGKVKVA
jgi:hypothetical protein